MGEYNGDEATGFQSPTQDYIEGVLDLAAILDLRRPGRNPVGVKGHTPAARGIQDGESRSAPPFFRQPPLRSGPHNSDGRWTYNGKQLLTAGEVLGFDRARQLVFVRDRVFDLPKSHTFETPPWSSRLGNLDKVPRKRHVASPGTECPLSGPPNRPENRPFKRPK